MPTNVTEVGLTEELLAEAQPFKDEPLARKRAEQRGFKQQGVIALASLERVFRLGETLPISLKELVTRIAAKMTAYTYAFVLNRLLSRPQRRLKWLWA